MNNILKTETKELEEKIDEYVELNISPIPPIPSTISNIINPITNVLSTIHESSTLPPKIPPLNLSRVNTINRDEFIEESKREHIIDISAKTRPKKPQIFEYEDQQIYILDKRFQRLHNDSVQLLQKSQSYNTISMLIKIIIIILSLATSYMAAFSSIASNIKDYTITGFSLTSAIISGITSIKNFSSEASRLYAGYVEYQTKCTVIEQIFYHFKSSIPYEDLIMSIDKLFNNYEKDLDKSAKQKRANAEKRIIYLQEIWQHKIKSKNDGQFPQWYQEKIQIENLVDRYDIDQEKVIHPNKVGKCIRLLRYLQSFFDRS